MKKYGMCLPLLLVLIWIFAPLQCLSLEPDSSMVMTGSGNPDAAGQESGALSPPAEIAPAAEGEAAVEPAAVPYTDYLRIAGSVLKPRESEVSWTGSGGGGCMYVTAGSSYSVFNVPVTLPQGSKISYLRMYFNDTNASVDSTAFFTVYDLYGDIVQEWGVNSTGSAGRGYASSVLFDHTVDYSLYSYVINWRPYDLGSDMQVCGFRLYYTPPPSANRAVFFPISTRP